MKITRLLKVGLVAAMSTILVTSISARPEKKKPEIEKPKKAAFEKRRKHRGNAKKKGHKLGLKKDGSAFGKLVRDDAKIKELRDAFNEASKKRWSGFDKDKWKDATDDEKKVLREQMAASRKEWMDQVKAHRKEVHARIKEIRDEFKNKRDEVIDGNNPGE